MARREFRVSSEQRFRVFSRRDNSRCSLGHLPLPKSSELASDPTLFFGNQAFHACGNFFMLQHFTTIDLCQAFFHLADEPFVVTHQSLDGFMHERFTVASLLRSNTVKLSLQLRRKIYFHAVSVSAQPTPVKALPSEKCKSIGMKVLLNPHAQRPY